MVGLKRLSEPCARCGWKYEGFHVCFDASKPCPGEGKINPRRKSGGPKTEEGRKIISQTTTERWERYRDENRGRDEKIVAQYQDGESVRALAKEYSMSPSTVINVIRREEAITGTTIMRPRSLHMQTRRS